MRKTMMEEKLVKVLAYISERIQKLKDDEEQRGGWDPYDEIDIQKRTEMEILRDILKLIIE